MQINRKENWIIQVLGGMNLIDEMNQKIIKLLKQDAKMKLQEIGDKVHLTGQAVSNRIMKLEKNGVIKGYTAVIDENFLHTKIVAYISVIMKTADHERFRKFLKNKPEIIEAHRSSGDACYLLKVEVETQKELNELLDQILVYANYRLNISIEQVK